MGDCHLQAFIFDVSASAGWYSSIAGLLAGFAFVAVLLPLDHTSTADDTGEAGASVEAFVCAFFSLLIVAIAYAVLAGRSGEGLVQAVAAHDQLLNGVVFGLASLLLLSGLRGVLGAYGTNRALLEPARGIVLAATGAVGPAVLLALQFSNSLDLERYRLDAAAGSPTTTTAAACTAYGMPSGVWVNLAIVGAGLLCVGALTALRNRLPRSTVAGTTAARWVLALAAVVVLWSSLVLPLLPPAVLVSAVFEHVTLALTTAATVTFSAITWASR